VLLREPLEDVGASGAVAATPMRISGGRREAATSRALPCGARRRAVDDHHAVEMSSSCYEPDEGSSPAHDSRSTLPRADPSALDRTLADERAASRQGESLRRPRSTITVVERSGSVVSLPSSARHELDHLDGVMIIDRTDDEHRKEALATLRPRAVLR